MLNRLWILLCLFLACYSVTAQDTSFVIGARLARAYMDDINIRADRLNKRLEKFTARAMNKMRNKENNWRMKWEKKDSIKAAIFREKTNQQYGGLDQRLPGFTLTRQYVPSLDTVITSLKFLEQNPRLVSPVRRSLKKLSELENGLQKAEEISQFFNERKQWLKDEFQNPGFTKKLKKLNKEVYYYGAQLKEYQLLLGDHTKAMRKVIGLLGKTKMFREFMQKNSMLAALFRPPGDLNNPVSVSSVAGLQTRGQINSIILQQVGTNGLPQFKQNLEDARSQLLQVKNEVIRTGGNSSQGNNNNHEGLNGFLPNHQKSKSFLKRLEYGVNIQTQKAGSFFPATSDIGLSVGYKLDDRSIVGIGASYKMGWGNGWREIKMTNQGVGLRSFLNWKLKGSLWLTCGYEQNYRIVFKHIDDLRNQNAWQQSGLAGFSKIVNMRTKFLKKAGVKLLWDFLSYRQTPCTTPVIFRVEYSL